MEPEVRAFLQKVGLSVFVALVWLSINSVAAIKNDNAFIQGPLRLANILFYIWFIISLVLLVYIYKKLWRSNKS